MSFRETLSTKVPKAQAVTIVMLVVVTGALCLVLCGVTAFVAGWVMRPELASLGPGAGTTPLTPSPSRAVEPTSSPTPYSTPTVPPTPVQGSVPPGDVAYVNDMAIVLEDATRPADEIVMNANTLNVTPDPGEEYVLVHISITCPREETADPCIFSPLLNFRLIGADSAYSPKILLMDVPGLLEGGEVRGGATVSGALAFVVKQDETDLTLMYETILGRERAFLAVP